MRAARRRTRHKADLVELDSAELGPHMLALPNTRWQVFVLSLVRQKPGRGGLTAAAREAGFGRSGRRGKGSTPATLAKIAWAVSRDDRTIAAVAEETKKLIRVGAPEAANALINLVRDPSHKDHGRAIGMILDRTDPVETRSLHQVVVHRVDPTQEAIDQLRALRAMGVPREKLLEVFGFSGLSRYERLLAESERKQLPAPVIEGEAVEVSR